MCSVQKTMLSTESSDGLTKAMRFLVTKSTPSAGSLFPHWNMTEPKLHKQPQACLESDG